MSAPTICPFCFQGISKENVFLNTTKTRHDYVIGNVYSCGTSVPRDESGKFDRTEECFLKDDLNKAKQTIKELEMDNEDLRESCRSERNWKEVADESFEESEKEVARLKSLIKDSGMVEKTFFPMCANNARAEQITLLFHKDDVARREQLTDYSVKLAAKARENHKLKERLDECMRLLGKVVNLLIEDDYEENDKNIPVILEEYEKLKENLD